MAERKKILMEYVIAYSYASSIPIYIQNLIKALNLLEDNKKPFIYLCYTFDAPIEDVKIINYPYIKFVPRYSKYIFVRGINKLIRGISGSKIDFIHFLPKKVDAVFPFFGATRGYFDNEIIEWITDFQQLYYPEFFSKIELENSLSKYLHLSESKQKLVLSSYDAKNDYFKFYPENKNDIKILRFTSILPNISNLKKEEVLSKYNLGAKYFITPNQFWPHKNHLTLIYAIDILVKRKEIPFKFVFTGKTKSFRDNEIFLKIESEIKKRKLSNFIVFTGFIPREDQLLLMKNSLAIIQPSLFEGWSTLVEESKALNKHIILSNLGVHLEQISKNCTFFNALDSEELADIIETYLYTEPIIEDYNYENDILKFANDLTNLF